MSEQTAKAATYTVQMCHDEQEDGSLLWLDIATVAVPAKSKRSTIIRAALAKAGIKPDPDVDPPSLRVLDERAATVERPAAKVTAPQWELM